MGLLWRTGTSELHHLQGKTGTEIVSLRDERLNFCIAERGREVGNDEIVGLRGETNLQYRRMVLLRGTNLGSLPLAPVGKQYTLCLHRPRFWRSSLC